MTIIGYAYVVADLFHVGHLKHIKACRGLCDKLIVGVLTDGATQEKKPAPIIAYNERIAIVEALRDVDVAMRQETYSPIPNAKQLQVDILFESTSHSDDAIAEAKKEMKKQGTRVMVMPYYAGISSTEIKEKITNNWRSKNAR